MNMKRRPSSNDRPTQSELFPSTAMGDRPPFERDVPPRYSHDLTGIFWRTRWRADSTCFPIIKLHPAGTGGGKTYSSLKYSYQALCDLKSRALTGVYLFIAPTKNLLSLSNWLGPDGVGRTNAHLRALRDEGITVARAVSETDLKDPWSPDSLFSMLLRHDKDEVAQALLALIEAVPRAGARDPEERDMNRARADRLAGQTPKIKKKLARYEDAARYEQDEAVIKVLRDDVKNTATSQYSEVKGLLRSAIEAGGLMFSGGRRDELIIDELYLSIFPWVAIQRSRDNPGVGMVVATTKKWIQNHYCLVEQVTKRGARAKIEGLPLTSHVNLIQSRRNKAEIHEPGDTRWVALPPTTRFEFFLDESDEAKRVLEDELSGNLFPEGIAPQAAAALYREVGFALSLTDAEANRLKALVSKGDEEAIEAEFRTCHHPAMVEHGLLTRDHLSGIREKMRAFRSVAGGQSLDTRIANRIRDCVQGHRYLAIRKRDREVQALGDDGLFTSGSYGFVNGYKLDRLEIQSWIDTQAVIAGLSDAGTENNILLSHYYDWILEILFLLNKSFGKGINEDQNCLKAILKDRRDESKDVTPIKAVIRSLEQGTVVGELLTAREHVDPNSMIDLAAAFREPEIVVVLTRLPRYLTDYRYNSRVNYASTWIPYRVYSAEHDLERIISPQAFAYSGANGSDDETKGVWSGFSADEAHPDAPASVIHLMSATGSYPDSFVGDFAAGYFEHSEFVELIGFTHEDAEDVKRVMAERKANRGALPAIEIDDLKQGVKLRLRDESQPNEFKKKEISKMLAMAGRMIGLQPGGEEIGTAVAFVQTHGRFREALWRHRDKDCLIRPFQRIRVKPEAVKGDLAPPGVVPTLAGLLPQGPAQDRAFILEVPGYKPLVVLLYDATLDKALATLEQKQCEGIAKRLGMPREDAAGLTSVNGFLSRANPLKVVVVIPYQSGGRGVNFVEAERAENGDANIKDVDCVALLMSPFYSKVKPDLKSFPSEVETPAHKGLTGEKAKAKRKEIGKRELHRCSEMHWSAGYYAVRQSQGLAEVELRKRDKTLSMEARLPDAKDFLEREHTKAVASVCLQAIGRGERTPAQQRQSVILDPEVADCLLEAYPYFYGDIAQGWIERYGGDLANPWAAASIATQTVMTEVRDKHLMRRYQSFDLEAAFDLDGTQDDALACYHTTKHATGGWLDQIDRLRAGELCEQERDQLTEQWEAFRHPDLLFNVPRYCERLREVGVPEAFIESMWMNPPGAGEAYLTATQQTRWGRHRIVVHEHDEVRERVLHPEVGQRGYNVQNEAKLQYLMPADIGREMYERESMDLDRLMLEAAPLAPGGGHPAPADERRGANRENGWGWLRPHLWPDCQGVWGELAIDRMIQAHVDRLMPMEAPDALFEVFDRYYALGKTLVGVDAKHYARRTELTVGERAVEKMTTQKLPALTRWANANGYERVVGIYLNARAVPVGADEIDPVIAPGALALNAFLRVDEGSPIYQVEDALFISDLSHRAEQAGIKASGDRHRRFGAYDSTMVTNRKTVLMLSNLERYEI